MANSPLSSKWENTPFAMTRTIPWMLAALMTIAMPVAAHEGHAHKTMGVVSMIHENHLEVTDLKDKKTTFTLDARTKIVRGRSALKPGDIKVGERVVVTYQEAKDKAGKVTTVVKQVQVGVTPATTSPARVRQE
jgi:hypothetical protein